MRRAYDEFTKAEKLLLEIQRLKEEPPVDRAVDVAKEAADIVLLKQDLEVLVRGVREGRATFANTLKYVFMATSANFGKITQTFNPSSTRRLIQFALYFRF
jgi:hypothetical protein